MNEDETAEVGAVLAVIGSGAAAPAAVAPAAPAAPAAPKEEAAPAAPAAAPAPTPAAAPASCGCTRRRSGRSGTAQAAEPAAAGESGYVTPLVRKLANHHGVDVSALSGTGVGGRIRKQDVLAAAEAKAAPRSRSGHSRPPLPARSALPPPSWHHAEGSAHPPGDRPPHARVPRGLHPAHAGARSGHDQGGQAPSQGQELVPAQNGVKLTFLPFIAKAVAEALKQHPKLTLRTTRTSRRSRTTTPSTSRSPLTRTRACWFPSSTTPAT